MQLIIQTLSGFKDMQRHRLVVQVAIVSLLTSVLALVGPAANPVSSQEIPLNLFTPNITIMVPDFDFDGVAGNDFEGETFDVTFTAVEGVEFGCSTATTEIWEISADGTVVRQSMEVVTLVNVPAAIIENPEAEEFRCSYTVAFPGSAAGGALALSTPGSVTVSQASAVAAAVYVNGSDTTFMPVVSIMVPDFDFDGVAGNDFEDAVFEVAYAPAAGAAAGCTAAFAETWVVDSGGVVARQGSGGVPSLVDRISGVNARCSYTVAFPGSAAGGALVLSTPGSVTVSQASAVAAAVYVNGSDTTFMPVVSIMVPDFDFDGVAGNDFEDAVFEVAYAPAAVGCTAAFAETWVVDSGGVVAQARRFGWGSVFGGSD